MSWEIGWDDNHQRDIGYEVPEICDHPDCTAEIDRGLSYTCGAEPYGGSVGCGLFFCGTHLYCSQDEDSSALICKQCYNIEKPFEPKPDVDEWINHILTHKSWKKWRTPNPIEVKRLKYTKDQL